MSHYSNYSESSEDDDLMELGVSAVMSVALLAVRHVHARRQKEQSRRRKRKHKVWRQSWLSDHRDKNKYIGFMEKLEHEDLAAYKSRLRMPPALFRYLLSRIELLILRENTRRRCCIPPEVRLAITIRYLSSGLDHKSLQDLFLLGYSTVTPVILDTCRAIISELGPEYLKVPTSPDEWIAIADGFADKSQYFGCLGAIDGKHIRIVKPDGSGSLYHNYKHFYSVVLMAVVDSNMEFLYINVGTEGCLGDAGIWQECDFKAAMESGHLGLPDSFHLPGTEEGCRFHFIGDDAFKLTDRLMKPFPGGGQDNGNDIFSYRLSRARMVVENAFGVLSSRFRLLHTAIHMMPDSVEILVQAMCILHNYLRRNIGARYTERGTDRNEHDNFELLALAATERRNHTNRAKEQRVKLADNYRGVGSLPWQDARVAHRVGRFDGTNNN